MSDLVTLIQEDSYNLGVWGGMSFSIDVQYLEVAEDGTETPILLNPATDAIVGKIARWKEGPILATFSATIFDGPNGWFRLQLTAAQTRILADNDLYEMALVPGGADPVGLWKGKIDYERSISP